MRTIILSYNNDSKYKISDLNQVNIQRWANTVDFVTPPHLVCLSTTRCLHPFAQTQLFRNNIAVFTIT